MATIPPDIEVVLREAAQEHLAICVPDGLQHPVERTCPCLATMALCCNKCGEPVFGIPVTGLPGCEHFDALMQR